MSSRVLDRHVRRPSEASHTERLIVTRRSTEGRYSALGYLEERDGMYEFVYLRSAAATPGLIPLPGFSDLERRYQAPYLFPLFAERVMSPRRPDRSRWLKVLDLDSDADAMEVLGRSSGRRHGDTIELFRMPRVDAQGQLHAGFLAHGVRHMGSHASEEIGNLAKGEELILKVEPDNEHNPCAVVVSSLRGIRLGYVPDPLAGFVAELSESARLRASVQVANGAEVIPHLRLLVAVTASVAPNYRPLSGPEWEPVDSPTDDTHENSQRIA